MKEVWTVFGNWECYTHVADAYHGGPWPVACYLEEEAAKEHARLANEWMEDTTLVGRSPYDRLGPSPEEYNGEYSSADRCVWAVYSVESLPLYLHPDQYLGLE